MKQRILFIFICFLLFAATGCLTPKKISGRTMENIKTNEKQNEASTTEIYSFVDTTKKSDFEIIDFKIEFYPPAGQEDIPDTMPEWLIGNTGCNPMAKPPNAKQGAIKSIEGYTVKANSEESGVNENNENITVNRNAEKNGDINRQVEIKEQPVADPYRWRYIFYILALIAVVLLYLNRIPVLNWIKTILSSIRRIL